MIEIQALHAGYGKKEVLRGLNATLSDGRLIAVIGPNGSGKSTLLKSIVGILPTASGSILVDGIPTASLSPKESAQRIAYLQQINATPDMTVAQLVLHGRFAHLDYPRRYRESDRKIAAEAMEQMGISAHADTPLASLSGGMRQNAYLAMALAQSTPHILLDEPTTYLDIGNRLSLMRTLRMLADSGKCVVAVLHDLTLAMDFADELLLLQDGICVANGTPQALYEADVIRTAFGATLRRAPTPDGGYYFLKE